MEILLVVLLVVVIVGFVFLFSRLKPGEKAPDQSLLMLQNQVNEIARVMDTKLGESARLMQRQFG